MGWTLRAADSEEAELEILPVGGLFLPLKVRRITHWQTAPVRFERDREKLRDSLAALALADARAKLLTSDMDWTLRNAHSADRAGALRA